jgi:transposase InsO family protein
LFDQGGCCFVPPGTFWAVARKSGQIRRIAAGPEPRAAPLEGEHDEDSQFDRAEHTPCCGKAGGGLVTVAWSHFEHIKRRKRWLRTRCGIDRSQRCLEALDEALARHGRPEIFNTDQGSQFTSAALTGLLLGNAIRISMDGRGSSRDNVFVKRLWRSVKYEEVYLRAYDRVAEARGSIGGYLAFYNRKRPHSSLNGRSPDQAYFCGLALAAAA